MAWQPLPPNHPNSDEERLIATGGEDCAILIWNARTPESKAKCFLNMNSPIVRLAFTPDGAFIAGATANQVLIWRVGSPSMPRATWSRPPLPGWISPKAGSETDEEDEHCLCWDASGKRLAYGSNSRVGPTESLCWIRWLTQQTARCNQFQQIIRATHSGGNTQCSIEGAMAGLCAVYV